jgi:hypothetical protein
MVARQIVPFNSVYRAALSCPAITRNQASIHTLGRLKA